MHQQQQVHQHAPAIQIKMSRNHHYTPPPSEANCPTEAPTPNNNYTTQNVNLSTEFDGAVMSLQNNPQDRAVSENDNVRILAGVALRGQSIDNSPAQVSQ